MHTVQQNVAATVSQNQKITTISKHIGKQPNNAKPPFLKVLFAAYVKTNRTPNGRSKGVTYWIHSQYKHLTHHAERANERETDSFFAGFCRFLVILQNNGKFETLITKCNTSLDLVPREWSISFRCLGNWFEADFPDTGINISMN